MTDFKKDLEFELKEIIKDRQTTNLKRIQFIEEIKNGLGEEIKKNPNGFKIIKKTKFQRFKLWLAKFFTKF